MKIKMFIEKIKHFIAPHTYTPLEPVETTYTPLGPVETLRKHLGNDIVITDVRYNAKRERRLKKSELLPGETYAATFTAGCYTFRNAYRVYYTYPERPADIKVYYADTRDPLVIMDEKYLHTNEIAAKHNSDPEGSFAGDFKNVGRCYYHPYSNIHDNRITYIDFICTLKEDASSSDEHASLFVRIKSSYGHSKLYSTEDWFRLTPNGVVEHYRIHSEDPASWEASWKDTE